MPQCPADRKTPPRCSWGQRLVGHRKSPLISAWSPTRLEPNQPFFQLPSKLAFPETCGWWRKGSARGLQPNAGFTPVSVVSGLAASTSAVSMHLQAWGRGVEGFSGARVSPWRRWVVAQYAIGQYVAQYAIFSLIEVRELQAAKGLSCFSLGNGSAHTLGCPALSGGLVPWQEAALSPWAHPMGSRQGATEITS